MILETAIVFSAVGITLNAAHEVADHVFGQTDYMADTKAENGSVGWSANLLHVFDYHLVMISMVLVMAACLNIPLSTLGLIAGFALSIISHAFLDRRWPVRWILEHTGSPKFAEMVAPICGMYLADQSLHKWILWIAALLIACL